MSGTLEPRTDRPIILDALRERGGVRPHAVIEASAGTGKTHALEHLVVDLIEEGVPLPEILVVTFTEKATLEMRARIRKRLAGLVTRTPAGAQGRALYTRALEDFDRAPISTIHAFCQRVLMENAFLSGRLLDEERVHARETFHAVHLDALRRGLTERAPGRGLYDAALRRMGPDDLEDVLFRWSKVRGRKEPRFDRDAIERALRAMPQAEDGALRSILRDLPHPATKSRVRATLLALAPIARAHAEGTPLDDLIAPLLAWTADAPSRSAEANGRYLARALLQAGAIGEAARTLEEQLGSPLPMLADALLPELERTLAEQKRAHGVYDFDDMLSLVAEALHGEDGERLAQMLRRRYRIALVDEFQDTDPIQWAIFARIFFESPRHTLVTIGDPKQSIYGFRNADVHTYLTARERTLAVGGVVVPLTDCFRSTAKIIDAVHALMAEDFWTGANEYRHPVRCGIPRASFEDAAGSRAPVVCLSVTSSEELYVDVVRRSLAAAIADEIASLLSGPTRIVPHEGDARSLEPRDIFVLVRSASEAKVVAAALARKGIAHAISSSSSIYRTREAADVIDVLRALVSPSSRSARLRAMLTPFFALRLPELGRARHLAPDHPFSLLWAKWYALARERRYGELWSSLFDESGLRRRLLYARQSERELTNYAHLFEILIQRSASAPLSLRELLGELERRNSGDEAGQDEDLERLSSESAAVQVLTMHKAKGLEAEVVFVFGGFRQRRPRPFEPQALHDGHERVLWMSTPAASDREKIEAEVRQENERLLYVALTRARSRLYLPFIGKVREDEGGEGEWLERLDGPLSLLGKRLEALLGSQASESADVRELFEVRSVPLVRGSRVSAPIPALSLRSSDPIDVPKSIDLRDLAAAFRAPETTSYTRMKAGRSSTAKEPTEAAYGGEDQDDADLWEGEVSESTAREVDPLPGGSEFGKRVHEILEQIEYRNALDAQSGSELLQRESALFLRTLRKAALPEALLPALADLVHRTLRTPIRVAGLELNRGFAELEKKVAELSFLHPIPERTHPSGFERTATATPAERGFVRGIIDLLFEHQGRIFVLDWKTDRLAKYAETTVKAHVKEHYAIQARLYTMGVARMLSLRDREEYEQRFGGLIYVFLRGLEEPRKGVHLERPSWSDVCEWDRAMREEDEPWGYPLPLRRRLLS